jgi:hypothetical protein
MHARFEFINTINLESFYIHDVISEDMHTTLAIPVPAKPDKSVSF